MIHPYHKNGFEMGEKAGIPLLTCTYIPFPHGFSTRIGGVSSGNGLDTLDLGAGEMSDVNENRRRYTLALSSEASRLITAKQIHSSRIETVGAGDIGRQFECDGFVTREQDLLLTVKTADCVPILLCDKEHSVIAAVHAGWRSTVSGIIPEALKAMVNLGASPESIVAAIGPSIKKCCYEVDIPFADAVKNSPFGELLSPYIVPSDKTKGKFYASLPEMNVHLLTLSGVRKENIHITSFCTCCANSLFFSHRASGGKRGLMMAGIVIPKQQM